MSSLVTEKIDQAIRILEELNTDAWLTFVRETTECGDPILPIILGQNLTWQSALILTRRGERIAIVGSYETDAVKSTGAWSEVVAYVESVRQPLLDSLRRIDPATLAINYSVDDVKADGLSHGMFLLLEEYLGDTPYGQRLVCAADIIGALRGRKTAGEVSRIRSAIEITGRIFDEVGRFAAPGRTEREVADFMHDRARHHGVGLAWDGAQCPIVNTGPESMIGHGIPSSLRIEPGHLFHIDFGVVHQEYCSDQQRMWYVPGAGESWPPEPVGRAFDTVVRAIQAAARSLCPGVACWEVDAAARAVITEAGYPEYQHATGHQVGRAAHDGGGILGPRWDRYGQTPYRLAEEGNVFTLELGIENVDGRGYIGLEEMVIVTAGGCEFMSDPQTKLRFLT